MEKKIILISKGSTFMVSAITSNLEEAGYEVLPALPQIEDLSEKKDQVDMIVFYLGDYIEEIPETLAYLKELVLEERKLLFIIGSNDEFFEFDRKVPDQIDTSRFLRPLNVRDLIEKLNDVIEVNSDDDRKKSIMIVDDDVMFLKLMKEWLSGPYRVTMANSGMRAITYLANNTPDLILLDYEMPVTNGPQVLQMIRDEATTNAIPVMFLTGKSDRESVLKVVGLKPDGYLLKSMTRDELLQQIRAFFEEQKMKRLQ
ncbi:Response regulator receiver domain-containing protein [Lachnospiraceae bacterium]|nr:Response regulator receiver domain-containing protein [Lachnospiraceae bacterium]